MDKLKIIIEKKLEKLTDIISIGLENNVR